MELQRLRVLVEVQRLGTLSAAARALDYTQPAVSHHVRRLEAEMGTALVMRAGRSVRLTEAGAILAARAESILAGVAAAEEEVAAIAGLRRARVRLIAFPSGAATLAPRAIALLSAEHPGLAVTLDEAEPPEALAALRTGDCDIALAFEYPEEADPDALVVKRALLDDPLLLALPERHRLAGTRRVRLASLRDETWIAGCPRCRSHLLHACSAAGFTPRIAFATDDAPAVLAMVAEGLGVALLPRLALQRSAGTGVVIRPATGRPHRAVFAAHAQGAEAVPAVAATLAVLERVAGATRPAEPRPESRRP
jgi:DNA-binding transcriptional LysR family regulator